MLENTEGTITNGQSRETGKIGYTRRRKTKQKHNTICVGHTNRNDENNLANWMLLIYTHNIYIKETTQTD